MEEVHHWEWTLRVYGFTLLPVPLFCFLCVDENVVSRFLASAAVLRIPWHEGAISLELLAIANPSFPKLLWSSCFITLIKKNYLALSNDYVFYHQGSHVVNLIKLLGQLYHNYFFSLQHKYGTYICEHFIKEHFIKVVVFDVIRKW